MKIFVTKYALTKGILELECEIINGKLAKTIETYPQYFKESEWFYNEEFAIKRSNKMKINKIASLERQLEKLKRMTFTNFTMESNNG
jgi:hypothetical protein